MNLKYFSKTALLSLGLAFQPLVAQASPAEAQDISTSSVTSDEMSDQAEIALAEIKKRGFSDFVIVDKNRAQIHVFDNGRKITSSPVLLGKKRGDDLGPTDEPRWGNAVTPAGRFSVQFYKDEQAYKGYGTNTLLHFICNRDQTICTSLHQTWTGVAAERRPQRMATSTIDDNYISNGCVNIDPDTWKTVLDLAQQNRHGGTSNVHMTDIALFILPEDEGRTMEYLGFSEKPVNSAAVNTRNTSSPS